MSSENSFWSNVGDSASKAGGKALDNVFDYLAGTIPKVVQKYTDKATGNLNEQQLAAGMTGNTEGVPINTNNQGWLNNAISASGFLQTGAKVLPWILGAGLVTVAVVKLAPKKRGRR